MWKIDRSKLLDGLTVLAMVPEKLGIPSSEFFWVRGKKNKVTLSVSSYISGEVTLEGIGDWPFKHDFFIDRRLFLPWCFAARELKNKNLFEFEKRKHQLLLSHGNRKVLLDSQSKVKGYGDTRKITSGSNNSIPISSELKEMLLCGKNCAVSDAVVPHLNCCYITKGTSGATAMEAYASSDKVYYLGSGKLEEGKIKASIPFPLFLISLLGVDGLKRISWIGNYVVLKFKQGIIWQPISTEALTKFPVHQIQKHCKRSDTMPITFTASSRRFSKLMVRLGYYLQSVRRKDWVVKVKGTKKKKVIIVTTSIPGAGFIEKIPTTERIPKDFVLEWPLDILEPTFEFISKKTKKLGVVVRVDEKHGISYVRAGSFWLAVTSRQE